jgi:hypothetical protein
VIAHVGADYAQYDFSLAGQIRDRLRNFRDGIHALGVKDRSRSPGGRPFRE